MKIDSDHIQSHELKFRIHFETQDFRVVETPFGLQIRSEDSQPGGDLGGPELLASTIRVALPAGTRATEVRVETKETAVLVGKSAFIAPLQPARPGAPSKGGRQRPRLKVGEQPKPSTLRNDNDEPFVEPLPAPDFVPPSPEQYEKYFATAGTVGTLTRNTTIGITPVAVVSIVPVVWMPEGQIVLRKLIELTVLFRPQPKRLPEETDGALRSPDTVADPFATVSLAQARRDYDLTKDFVINPELVSRYPGNLIDVIGPAEYLIITDNHTWDETTKRPLEPVPGDMVAEFERLAEWKRTRGLTARVVTISDIVAGSYGEFNQYGVRDLQEVLHQFIGWARLNWGVSWLLLGGDVDVLPVRSAIGAANGTVGISLNDPPDRDQAVWSGTFLKFNATNWAVNATTPLVISDNGLLIPYDSSGISDENSIGWYFTDESYGMRSSIPTSFVRVNGPESRIRGSLLPVNYDNTIPTDLYYANHSGGSRSTLRSHPWDRVRNGLYGQHTADVDLDGDIFRADISVGRAPASTAEQARAFVNKVLAYEQLRSPDGSPLSTSYVRKALFVSSNWGGRIGLSRFFSTPPDENTYFLDTAAGHSILHLEAPLTVSDWRLFSQISDTDLRSLPYTAAASPANPGWYFARSETDLTPSEFYFIVPGSGVTLHTAIPTRWVVVFAPPAELSPAYFIFDVRQPDGSLTDQEELRAQVQTSLPGYTQISRLYEDEVDLTAAQAAAGPFDHLTEGRLEEKLNEGQHLVSLSGHGWSGGCCGFYPDLGSRLSNQYQTFIVYADSCYTNEFNLNDAISEILLSNPNGGAVAYVGNSRYSWIGIGDNFQRGFFRRLTQVRNLGLLHDMRTQLVDEATGYHKVYNKWTILSLNLMGDPEMPVWRSEPRRVRFTDEAHPRLGDRGKKITVTTRFGRAAVPGVLVTIKRNGFFQQQLTDEQGVAFFDLRRADPGPTELIATKEGFAPAFGMVELPARSWTRVRIREVLSEGSWTRIQTVDPVSGEPQEAVLQLDSEYGKSILCLVAASLHVQQLIDLELDLTGDRPEIKRARLAE